MGIQNARHLSAHNALSTTTGTATTGTATTAAGVVVNVGTRTPLTASTLAAIDGCLLSSSSRSKKLNSVDSRRGLPNASSQRRPTAPSAAPINAPEWQQQIGVFLLTFLAYCALYSTRKPLSVVKSNLQSELGFSTGSLGAIDTCFLSAYAFGQLVIPPLSQKYAEPPTVLLISYLGSCATALLFGSSSVLLWMLPTWLLAGLFHAAVYPLLVRSVGPWFGPNVRGRVLGTWTTSQQIGSLLATAFATFTSAKFGWRWTFYVPAVLTGCTGLALYILLPRGCSLNALADNTTPPNVYSRRHDTCSTFPEDSRSSMSSSCFTQRLGQQQTSSDLRRHNPSTASLPQQLPRRDHHHSSGQHISPMRISFAGTDECKQLFALQNNPQNNPQLQSVVGVNLPIDNVCQSSEAAQRFGVPPPSLELQPSVLSTETPRRERYAAAASSRSLPAETFWTINSTYCSSRRRAQRGRCSVTSTKSTGHCNMPRGCAITGPPVTFCQALFIPDLIKISVAFFFIKFVRYSLLCWLPFYITQGLGYEKSVGGYSSTMFDVGGIGGAVFTGVVSDFFLKGRRLLAAAVMSATAAVSVLAFAVVSPFGFSYMIISMAVAGFAMAGPDSVLGAAAAQDLCDRSPYGVKALAISAGVVNGMGSAGAAVQSNLVAIVSDRFGWLAAFGMLSLFLLIAATLLGFSLRRESAAVLCSSDKQKSDRGSLHQPLTSSATGQAAADSTNYGAADTEGTIPAEKKQKKFEDTSLLQMATSKIMMKVRSSALIYGENGERRNIASCCSDDDDEEDESNPPFIQKPLPRSTQQLP